MMTNFGEYDSPTPRRGMRAAVAAAILGLGVLATSTGSATAQGYQGTQDAQTACTPDVFRLCQQYIPNRGPIVSCLIRYRAYLSPACRPFFAGPTRVAKAKKTGKSRKARRAKRAR
jgi:hypothetical protein